MPTTTNTGFDTAAASPALGVLALVEMEFLSGTLFLTNWPVNTPAINTGSGFGAQVYTGLGNLGKIGEIKESEDGQTQSLDLELSQVNASNLALALGSVNGYQGRNVRVYVALTDTNLAISGSPVLRFAGFMDTVKVKRDAQSNAGVITMTCKTGGYDVRKNPAALRLNDSQHQANHPGELGFQYVPDLIGKPTRWLSTNFSRLT